MSQDSVTYKQNMLVYTMHTTLGPDMFVYTMHATLGPDMFTLWQYYVQ